MKIIFFISMILWSFLITFELVAQERMSYQVIAHTSNPTIVLTKKQVSDYFLKKTTTWQNGKQVHVVDLMYDSSIREVFSRDIHNRTVSKIKTYWQQQIFEGRRVPPPQMESEDDVLNFISNDPLSIAYISKNKSIANHEVKALTIVE